VQRQKPKATEKALTHNPRDLLFISDGVKEIRAACDAGTQAIICDRDVQAPRGEEGKTVIHSFDEVFPE
jgi:methionine salvage enolase-phosphatase E1